MYSKIIRIAGAVLAVLLLGGGGSCAFVASSGGSGSGDEEQSQGSNFVLVIRSGRLVDGPVEGVQYESASLSGVTGPNGEFEYTDGDHIRFFIGDIPLGETVPAKPLMSPVDLVSNGDINTPAVINIARLLQSLDSVPGDDRITIPASQRSPAMSSDRQVAAAVGFLDYADEAAFNNAASQLVASLTADYTFTAVLVDADTARRHLQQTLRRLQQSGS